MVLQYLYNIYPFIVLIQVVLLCRTVLDGCDGQGSDDDTVLKAFVLALLSPVRAVRVAAIQEAKTLLARQDKAVLARQLVKKLNEVLEEGKIFAVKEKSPPEERADVTGKMILDCVQALCCYRGDIISKLSSVIIISFRTY